MKTWILALALAIGLNANAQENKKHEHVKLTPEQRTELKTKQMTLALDLNDGQMASIKKLLADRNAKAEAFKANHKANKEAGKKLSSSEKFAMKNKMLDSQIAMKREMKKILNEEQYAKWEKMKKNKVHKMKKRHHNFKKHQRR